MLLFLTPLDQQAWWEFGIWCMMAAVFGSFVKSFCVDNITSVRDIFKQVMLSMLISFLVCLYGSYKTLDKRLQIFFSMFFGFVGQQGLFFLTGKFGELFTDIGGFMKGEPFNKPARPDKRIRQLPPVREQRKRNVKHGKR